MDTVLLNIGKTSQHYLNEGINEYEGRIRRYINFKIDYLPDVKGGKSKNEGIQKTKEGESILSYLSTSDICVLLDENGVQPTSTEFANFIGRAMGSGRKKLVFVVGGPYGFSDEVYARADKKISLSKMTFTHEMARLIFTEQLYRAMTILKGEPYHHG